MWINFENGNAVNLALATSIFIDHDTLFYVTAVFSYGNEILKAFDNEKDAKNFVAEIVDTLNGKMTLGYAFTWLDKPAQNEIADKPTKPADDLVDGVPL